MVFGIAKGFGFEERVESVITENFQGEEKNAQREVVEKVISFAKKLLDEAKGGVVAGIGVVFLLWSIIKLLGNIENAFNTIWGVKTPRSLGRRFCDYPSIMLFCTILMGSSSSLTVFVAGKIDEIIKQYEAFSFIGPFVDFMISLTPYIMVWAAFIFIFVFMPNTKVRLRSGLFAGIIAGTIFQIVQFIYIKFQIGVAKYGAIYGSFAALPLFLIWLQVSWFVVLFGGELSFAHQNVDTYEFEPDCLKASNRFKKKVSLWIAQMLVKNFCNEKPPSKAEDISHDLEIPIRLTRLLLFDLVEAGILSEVKVNGGKDVAYQPGVDVNKLSVEYVVNALETNGKADVPVGDSHEIERLTDCLDSFKEDLKNSPANVLLKDL
jgi:membrane protein